MDDGLAEILETCLVRLADGASLEECLAAYPEQRADLEAPLLAAMGLTQLPRPAMPSNTRMALEAQMLARAAARRSARPRWRAFAPSALLAGILRVLGYGGPLSAPWLRLTSAAIALLLALVLGAGAFAAAGAIIASVASPPTPTPAAPPAPTTFTLDGIVEQIDQEGWVVSGTMIAIDSQTVISGAPAVGSTAHISGVIRADGTRLARSIATTPPPTPTHLPTPTATLLPTVTPTLSPTPPPTVTPTLSPTPSESPRPTAGSKDDHKDDGGGGKDNTCHGKQKGRNPKKCDPKHQEDKQGDQGRKKEH